MANRANTTFHTDSATKRDRIRRDDRRIARASKRAWLTFASSQPV
jgi:hypothetical protein